MATDSKISEEGHNLASDILTGASDIAEFIFGSPNDRRRVYHLARKGQLPCFRMGAILYARRSTVLAWIEEQERLANGGRS